MALTDARVKFLRGLQANLPVALTDGNVYIATDERAMYVDYNDGTNVQRIRIGDILEYNTMTDIRALPTTSLSTSALYYAKDDNILCKWTGSGWRQINAQKALTDYISSIVDSVSLSGDIATITNAIKNDSGVSAFTTDHKLETADNTAIKLTIDANTRKVIFRGRNVTASTTAAVAADGTITLSNVYTGTDSSGNAVNSTVASTSIKITHNTTGGVKVTGNASTGVITIDSDYRMLGAAANSTKSLDIGLSNINSAGVMVEESKMRLTPRVVVGNSDISQTTVDAVVSYTTATKEAIMTLTLPVYTISQIDNLISTELKNLNSMAFKGNIKATGGTVTAPPLTDNTVRIGDTYIVADASGNYNTNTSGSKQQAIKGDLFIATSVNAINPENTLGYIDKNDIQWVYVPSGDDALHTYSLKKATTNAASGSVPYIYLENEANIQQGPGIGIGAGLESEDITYNGNTITVLKHKIYSAASATAGTAVSLSQNASTSTLSGSITAITGLTMENGHVTGYTTQQFSVALSESITESRFTNSITNNVVTLKADVRNSAGVWLDSTGMTLSSNSLTFTRTSAAAMNVDLLWETF